MKNSTKILIALTSLVLWVACQEKAVYVTSSFVRFGSTSMSVNEDVGTVSIPVYAFQSDGSTAFPGAGAAATSTSVTFEMIDSTAVSGIDYELVEPANGVLEFQGDSVQYITVRIIDRPEDQTGTLRFSIRLSSATNGYSITGARSVDVRILDLNQTTDDLLGSYTATGESYYYGASTWTMTFTEDESNANIRLIDGLVPDLESYDSLNGLYGTLSDDGLSFSIELPYWLNVTSSGYYLAYVLYDGQYYYSSTQTLTFTYESGQWTSDNGVYAIMTETNGDVSSIAYAWDLILPGIVLEAQ